MNKYAKLIIPILILFSCRFNTESKGEKSARLFKEASASMMTGFKLEVNSSDSSKHYYRQAINKFITAYLLDTSALELAIYLPDLYYKINEPDSALFWQSRIQPIDTIQNVRPLKQSPHQQ